MVGARVARNATADDGIVGTVLRFPLGGPTHATRASRAIADRLHKKKAR